MDETSIRAYYMDEETIIYEPLNHYCNTVPSWMRHPLGLIRWMKEQ
jgi:hypothetical protein